MTRSSLLTRLLAHMETIAPLCLADKSWDNVGLLLDPPNQSEDRSKVVIVNDLTDSDAADIVSMGGVGAIVAYHPVIFRPIKQLSQDEDKERAVMRCIADGIPIFCPHTALDSCPGGINDHLASLVGEGLVTPLKSLDNLVPGAGVGRLVTLNSPRCFGDLLENLMNSLGLRGVQYAMPKSTNVDSFMVKTVAICAGSGASVLLPHKADVYLTGEMSHHEMLAALGRGTAVVACGHTETESPYLNTILQDKLQSLFDAESKDLPAIKVIGRARGPTFLYRGNSRFL